MKWSIILLLPLFAVIGCNNDENVDGPGGIKFGPLYGKELMTNVFEVTMKEPVRCVGTTCYDSNDNVLTKYEYQEMENFSLEFEGSKTHSMNQTADSKYRIEIGANISPKINRIEISWVPVNESEYDDYVIGFNYREGRWISTILLPYDDASASM